LVRKKAHLLFQKAESDGVGLTFRIMLLFYRKYNITVLILQENEERATITFVF